MYKLYTLCVGMCMFDIARSYTLLQLSICVQGYLCEHVDAQVCLHVHVYNMCMFDIVRSYIYNASTGDTGIQGYLCEHVCAPVCLHVHACMTNVFTVSRNYNVCYICVCVVSEF